VEQVVGAVVVVVRALVVAARKLELVLGAGVVVLAMVVEDRKLEQVVGVVVLAMVVEDRKLEQVVGVEVVAGVVVLAMVVEDRKLEQVLGVVMAQVAVRILFSVARTLVSLEVAHTVASRAPPPRRVTAASVCRTSTELVTGLCMCKTTCILLEELMVAQLLKKFHSFLH
jgi:hypothetical protein